MFKVLRPIKDAYITDRVVNSIAQVGANVGAAGSLDLFKLYGFTSTMNGTSSIPNVELSRLLVQFDLNPLRDALADGQVDITNPTFSCKLHLHDVYGGQPTPNNFTVAVYPLSSSFDEGLGRDVVFYSDSDACNWLTSSWASGSWVASGCAQAGNGSTRCDYITASLNGSSSYLATQFFPRGTEDLNVDITRIVSATLAGLLPDAGLRISFVPSIEGDQHTYFVKRFASRTAFNDDLHPKLEVRFDDSIQDDTADAFLDATNTFFLYNYSRSSLSNLTSGTAMTPVTGTSCMQLWLDGDFPSLMEQVVSSTIVTVSGTPFQFLSSSNLRFNGSYDFVSSSTVFPFPQVSQFTINPGSFFAFVGQFSGTLINPRTGLVYSGFATNDLCSGTVNGTYIPPFAGILSGVFVQEVEALNPINDYFIRTVAGAATFVGTIDDPNANPGIDTYNLVGTFVPIDPSSFSSSYAISSTYVTAIVQGAQLVGSIIGTVPSVDPEVPSGSFYLADGVTPFLNGLMTFSGTLMSSSLGSGDGDNDSEDDGTNDVPPYTLMAVGALGLTGSVVPDGPFTFSGTYAVSSTYASVDYILGPFSASQHYSGINPQVGIYSSSVFIPSSNPNLLAQWQFSGSITVVPIWASLDNSVGYLTGSAFKIHAPQRGTRLAVPSELTVSVLGLLADLAGHERTILRVNIFDRSEPIVTRATRLPVEVPGLVIRDVHYQVRDAVTGRIAVPFDLLTNSTRLSNDSSGMYFKLDAGNLTRGHTYVVDIMVVTANNRQLYKDASAAFRVDVTN